jgi:hypothetical protein
LEEYKRVLPKNQFKTEYLGEWLDDEGVVFENFKDCVMNITINRTDKLFVGIDWASGVDGDETVVSIIDGNGRQVFIDGWNNLNTTQTIERLMNILQPYLGNITTITTETNSIGKPYTDLLIEKLPVNYRNKVQGFTTSNTSKAELVSDLQVAFQERKITILDDERLIRQLSTYAAEYNPKTKIVTYNAPRGLHDDRVMSLMLSYHGYKQRQTAGVYCLGNSSLSRR